ncbi:Wzz/FepE/Etk N-terminal domain-containing protein [Mesorhizobium sp. CAU 1741]|uniref:GumC family protein n=1 Tax=Mesorhizobium sp. CAU 1741 TaxID=3140366 RepID=UPI00325B62B2
MEHDIAPQPFDLHGSLNFLLRQIKLIVSTIIAVIGLVAVGLFLTTPLYSAATLVLVDPNRKSLLDPALRGMDASADNARVGSDVEIMRSDRVLLKVIRDRDLASDGEFGSRIGLADRIGSLLARRPPIESGSQQELADVLDNFREKVSVRRRGLTNLVAVTVRSEDARKSADLADAIARAHIALEVQAKIDATRLERSAIEARIMHARTNLVEAETALSRYVADHMNRAVGSAGNAQLTALRDEIAALRERKAEISNSLSRRDVSADRNSFSVREPVPGRFGGTAADATGMIMTASLRDEVGDIDSRLAIAQESFAAAFANIDLPPPMLADLHAARETAANAKRHLETLLSRRLTLEAEAVLQVPDSRIVSEATAAAQPSFPSLPLIATLAGFAACGIGVGAAFLRENYVGGFTTVGQLASVAKRRVGAVLPNEPKRRGFSTLADAYVAAPFSGFCEGVRRLRAAVDTALNADEQQRSAHQTCGKVVMVTSALPEEGKTTVALSLARAYALSGRSVILLDCDLRKPALHSHLAVKDSTGLVDVLTGRVADSDLSRILVADPRSDLTSIVGGRHADIPTDQLFATRSFSQIIASARASFDYVVIDAPPIEPVVDGMYLARHADAIVFVVRWARTPQRAVVHALDQLALMIGASTKVVATLNGQKIGLSGYRRGYAGGERNAPA